MTDWIEETPFDSIDYLVGAELPDTRAEAPSAPPPIALFLAGGPLSGKTMTLEHFIAERDDFIPRNAVVIDPRAIRTHLPDFSGVLEGGGGRPAESVYGETIHIGGLVVPGAVGARRNLILDGMGAGRKGAFAK